VPATQDVTRSYLVQRKNADGTHTIGSFSLTVKSGDKVSTVSEQTQAVDGLEVSDGVATLKPSVPSTDGEHVTLSLLPVEFNLRASPGMRFHPQSENQAYNAIVAALGNGIDQLGELPMGYGNAELPGAAYVAPVEVYATVPNVQGISWHWKRYVNRACWRVHLRHSDGPNGPQTGPYVWKVFPLFSENKDDDPQINHQDVTPSAAGRIYTGDGSGVNLPLEANPLSVGDYLYYEKQFTYKLLCTAPNGSFEIGAFRVAQLIGLKRTGQNGNASDFQPLLNLNYQGGVDVGISQQEVWSLTGNRTPVQLP